MTHIPKKLRELVRLKGNYRCGYCLTSEEIVGAPMEIDHYVPASLGGATEAHNLWPICSLCNVYKSNKIAVRDPASGENVPVFNPHTDSWLEHFEWVSKGERIVGKTEIGRATVSALKLNRSSLVRARKAWITAGWHPPKD